MADKTTVENVAVNAGEMEVELVEKLDLMCEEDVNNRSQFIRKLIRQEWSRRHQPVLFDETGIKVKSVVKRGKSSVAA